MGATTQENPGKSVKNAERNGTDHIAGPITRMVGVKSVVTNMKSATQEFIEDAIAGGWGSPSWIVRNFTRGNERVMFNVEGYYSPFGKSVSSILLDPEAWKAVGKTRGWDESYFHLNSAGADYQLYDVKTEAWKMNIHRFIDHLADGKTIEEALSALKT